MTPTAWPWDVNIDTTRPALERTMRALLITGSKLTCSLVPRGFDLGRGVSAELRVQVPDGEQDRFREIARPYRMAAPGRVQVGMLTEPDDGHPGRKR